MKEDFHGTCADGPSYPEFAYPLHENRQHDINNPDPSDHQRYRGNGNQDQVENALGPLFAVEDVQGHRQLIIRVLMILFQGVLHHFGYRFDLIFVDPPYESEERDRALQAIVAADLLTADGMVVLEGPKRHSLAPVEGLTPVDERTYGDTSITRLTRPVGRFRVPAVVPNPDTSLTSERE